MKMFLVKREVMARSLKAAMTARGTIYEISEVQEKDQPIPERKVEGFKPK